MKSIIVAIFALGVALQASADQVLKNGAPFFGVKDADLPRNAFVLSFRGGPALLAPEQQGVLLVLRETIKEGPASLTLKDFKDQLFKLGAQIDAGTGSNVFQVTVKTPPSEQAKVLGLLKDTLANLRGGKEDFERIRARVLAGVRAGFEDMRSVTFYFGSRDFMSYAPQVMSGDTSPGSLEKLTFEQYKEAVGKVLDYQRMYVAYAGPESEAIAKKQFESAFGEKLKSSYVNWKPAPVVVPQIEKSKYTIIEKPGATDNQIFFVFPQSVKRDRPEWVEGQAVMDLLGGGLHGRLAHTLRTERGLTYTAMSGFNSSNLPFWLVWTFGGIEQVKPLLDGVPEVIEKFKSSKLTGLEVGESKERLLNEYKSETELASDRVLEKAWYYRNGLDASFAERYSKVLAQLSPAGVNSFRGRLQSKNAAVYLMGDKEVLLKALESAGIKRDSVRVVGIADIK